MHRWGLDREGGEGSCFGGSIQQKSWVELRKCKAPIYLRAGDFEKLRGLTRSPETHLRMTENIRLSVCTTMLASWSESSEGWLVNLKVQAVFFNYKLLNENKTNPKVKSRK